MQLARFPRLRLAHLPTPLEPMERLSRHLGGPRLYIKRDDCTGLAGGGNKTRKLEFLMADARRLGADTVITTGGVQSNHVRQTAAAAARLGVDCVLVLARSVPWDDPDYERTGNVFLDHLLGADVRLIGPDTDRDAEMARINDDLRQRGKRPYVIPAGGSNAVGALGYAAFALELVTQAEALDLAIDAIVLATGSGGTQGGLVAGLAALNADIAAIGIDIDAEAEVVRAKVTAIAAETAERLGLGGAIGDDAVTIEAAYAGDAYGMPTPEMVAAARLVARLEGIILDPVYTGKAMAGLIDLVRQGRFAADDTVVFVHSGGMPALFAYRSAFAEE